MAIRVLYTSVFIVIITLGLNSCKEKPAAQAGLAKGSFGYDLNFLKRQDSVVVLQSANGNGRVIISPKYQAKVFTSTAAGLAGKSFGWINYKTFDQKSPDAHMNAFGGEDRLWLGPEGGKFSVFFKPGTAMEFANWHTPSAFDFENWKMISQSKNRAAFNKTTTITNRFGTVYNLAIMRSIEIVEPEDIKRRLGVKFDANVQAVGFSTSNSIWNTGKAPWDKLTGAPCLWNLDMFSPSAKTVIVVPYRINTGGKVATTDYFGKIPSDRIKYLNGVLLFKADGKSRGKLGIPPTRSTNRIGSYDAENNVLTIAMFDIDPKSVYLNQEWKTDKDPFAGDAVNAYNDGPLKDGTQMGPFYEIESVSPAAFLAPSNKEGMDHRHQVFHFTGDVEELNQIALKTLSISLQDIQAAFK